MHISAPTDTIIRATTDLGGAYYYYSPAKEEICDYKGSLSYDSAKIEFHYKFLVVKWAEKRNCTSLNDFIAKKIGKKVTKKRDKFDSDYEAFKLGVLIQQARQEKGLTQDQVAELSGTDRSYISKLEKDLKDVRFSTLRRIITEGLGGHLEISIKFDK